MSSHWCLQFGAHFLNPCTVFVLCFHMAEKKKQNRIRSGLKNIASIMTALQLLLKISPLFWGQHCVSLKIQFCHWSISELFLLARLQWGLVRGEALSLSWNSESVTTTSLYTLKSFTKNTSNPKIAASLSTIDNSSSERKVKPGRQRLFWVGMKECGGKGRWGTLNL